MRIVRALGDLYSGSSIVCYSMYLLGIIVAIVTAFLLSRIDGSKAEHALLIELPEYIE